MTYDNRVRLKTASNAGTSGVPDVLLTYEYDDIGNVTSVTDSLGGQNAYVYDALNRAIQIAQSGSSVNDKRVDFAYNNLGQFEAIDRYDDLTGLQLVARTDYQYDELNRLDRLSHNNGTDDLAFYDFAYDASSRITEIESIDGISRYEYDDRSQLTEADHSFQEDETYSYDENGNRTNDGYATETNNRLQSDGVYNYEYDNEGNLIRKTDIATGEETVYTWDYRNRLARVETPSQTVEYGYDAGDRRISKTVDGVTTGFVYDGDDVLLEFENSSLDKRYLHGVGIDQVLAQEEAGEVLWHLTDHLGTVRDLVNSDGEVVNHITYDSFGNVVGETDDTIDTRYLFTGREFDDEIGLYYYRARYYDGSIGRFISEDPIGFNGGDANLYRYVGNSPTNAIDPNGLETIIIIQKPHSENPVGHAAIYVDGNVYNIGQDGLAIISIHEWARWIRNETHVQLWNIYYTEEQEERIISYFENLEFGEYNLFNNNCTTTILDSLPREDLFSTGIRFHRSPVGLNQRLLGAHYGFPGIFGKARGLPKLYKPSAEKIEEAQRNGEPLGFELPDGTRVNWENGEEAPRWAWK